MNPFSIDYPPGATPLDPNELDGLIPDYITTQAELNALERENITEATTSGSMSTYDFVSSSCSSPTVRCKIVAVLHEIVMHSAILGLQPIA